MRLLFLISAIALSSLAVGADGQQSLRDLVDKEQSLRDLLGGRAEEEPLPPERAFVMKTEVVAPDAVGVTFTPAPTYYLYRSKFAFAVTQPAEVKVQDVQLPSGEVKDDPNFGPSEVYHQRVQALVSLHSPRALPREVELSVTMQGCTERGLCYPPDTRRVKVQLAAAASNESVAPRVPLRWAALALALAGAGALALWYARRRRNGHRYNG
jgi:thioredoxin:protein disulfide reductase